jgi:hypothetical protein
MFAGKITTGGPAVLAGTLALGLMVPAAAGAKASLGTVTSEVHAANTAIVKVARNAHRHARAAEKALVAAGADAAKAAALARQLGSAGASQQAAAVAEVAAQYATDVKTETATLKTAASSLKPKLARALKPAVKGETEALSMLGSLSEDLPAGEAAGALGEISTLLQQGSTELASLSGLLEGGSLTSMLESILSSTLTTAGGSVATTLADLENLIPQLPAADQPIAQEILTQLQSALGETTTTLGTVSTTVDGLTPTVSTELGQVTNLLGQLLGSLADLAGTLSGGATGTTTTTTGATTTTGTTTTGTTTTGTTVTGSGSLAGLFGGLPFTLPSGLTSLLGGLGLPMPIGL